MNQNYNFVRGLFSHETNARKGETKSSSPKKQALLPFLMMFVALFSFSLSQAQIAVTVTGASNTTPVLSSSYTTLALALTGLNAVTAMSGPVVLTLGSGTSETAPIKGFAIGSATLNPLLSATKTITINKSGAGDVTINAGIGIASGPSASPDGMFYLLGADYVTIDGLTFTDSNSASSTVAMEFGVALFKRAAGDGCNNNIIQNCTFNMQRINNSTATSPMFDGTWGIYVLNSTATAATTSLTPTNGGTLANNGTNSNNKFYANTINGGNGGIALSGFSATVGVGPAPTATTFLGDINNDIGGTASGTGNTILNFGGGASTNPSAGIRANYQWSINMSYNTINNNNGSGVNHATTLRGIYAQAGVSGNATINNNTVTVSSGATTSGLTAIDNGIGSTAASNTVNINNNVIRFSYTTATTGVFNAISNAATAGAVNINGNNIQQLASTVYPSTGTVSVIGGGSPGGTLSISNNTIANFNITGASGTLRAIVATTPTGLYTCSGNTIENLSYSTAASTGNIDGIYNVSSATLQNWNNNIIRNFSTPTTGTLQGIRNNTITGTFQCKNNQIYNFFTTAGGAGGFSANGISWSNSNVEISGNVIYSLNSTGSTGGTSGLINGISSGGSASIYNNKIYDLSSTSTGPLVAGITISGGTTNNIYNNIIGGLIAPAASGTDVIRGISITSTATTSTQNVYYNTIYLNGSSTGTNFGSSGIFHTYNATGTTSALDLRNNIIVNGSAARGTGLAVAFRRSAATDLANFATTSNNNLYYGTSGLYTDGTNTDATLAAYKTRVSTRDTNSISNNPTFASTTGSDVTYLHFDTFVNNVGIDRGAVAISGYTTDFDGNPRDVSNPDIGADEYTAVVACATYSAPADAATGQAQTGVQLTWTAAANATGYDVYFDQNATPIIVVATNQAGTTYNTGILAASTTYYWKIVPKNGAGAASCATVWSFTTPAAVPTLGTIPAAPSAVAFTNVCNNTTSAAVTFKMNGINLTGTDVTITAPAGFTVSENNTTFSSSIIVNHTSGMFTNKLIYVKFSPTTTTAYASTITISGGGLATNVDVALTGTVTESLNGLYSVGATNLAGEAGHFATLTLAVNTYNSYCLTGPVVFSLTDTSYSSAETFPIVVNANTLASATNTLTIKPATGVVTSITGSSTAAIIKLNGADYVILDGSNTNATDKSITVENTNISTSSSVVWLGSASASNGATNNTIKNIIAKGNGPATTLAAIMSSSGTTSGAFAEAANTNLTIQNNTVMKAQYGIGVVGNTAYQTGTVISDNTVGSNTATEYIGYRGIFIFNVDAVSVRNNSIFNIIVSTATTVSGIEISTGVINGSISSNKISGIKSTTTLGYGAYGINFGSATGTTGVLVANNMITGIETANYSTTSAQYNAFGIRIGAIVPNIKIYNNTINLYGSVTSGTSAGMSSAFCTAAAVTGLDLRNNVFRNVQTFGATGSFAYNMFLTTGTTFTEINYNDYYGSNGTNTTYRLGYSGSAAVTNLAAWKTFTTKDLQSIDSSPNFVSNTDLHMNLGTNLALDNVGTVIAGITTDIDGDVRSGSTPDIGADEFTTLDCTTQTLTAGTVSATNPALCETGSTTITASGYTIGINTTYEWESATDMAFTTPVSMGAASATYTNLATGTITATTYYRLKTICSGTTFAYATPIAVVVNTPAVTTVSAAVTICSGVSTPLTAAGSTNYAWSPATGLSATTGTSVTATPTATTTYTVTGTDTNGCTTTATVVVTVSPTPSAITIAKNPTSICEGGVTTLTASGGTIASSGTAILGTGTLATSTTAYPNPFSAWYGGVKHQMLYTATELQAQGLTSGSSITQLKFDLAAFVPNACTNFTIRMGTTSNTALTTFVSGTSTVYGPTTFTPSATGIITFTLTTPFVWNGTSNIIVETVHNAGNGGNGTGTTNKYTTTATNTVFSGASDSVTGGISGFDALTTWGLSGASANRPNTQFVYSSLVPTTFDWLPTTDLYIDLATTTSYTGQNVNVVYSKSTSSQTYTATSTLGSCSVSTPVTVTPNALPTITLDATTPVCNGGTSSSLSYTATTGTPTQYTIDFNETAELAGFADVLSYTTLTSPISLVVPAGAAPGTYTGTVSVKNANGCISAIPQTFTVVINTPVAITTQPSNSVSLENSNASFTVVASGSGLTYQWQESTDNGVTWNNISGATSATYTALSVTNGMNGYQYQCIVSGATPCTSVTSSVVSLTISTTAIATQPLSTTICSNETATFTIATTGTTPTYQWQISTNNGTSWSDIAGETTTTLNVFGLTAATTQRYRCVLSGLINSDAAILTVNDIVAITTQPADVTVCSNAANATFTTVATGTGLTYQWQQRANSSGTWANVGTGTTGGTTATLTISTLSTSLDGYQYQCLVTGTAPCVSPIPTPATLSVTGYTLANSTTNNSICNGGSVTFTATPTASSPAITYSWICATAGSGATTAVTGSSATITPTQLGTYTYTLTATSGSCSFTSTQTITVNTLPVITTATANPNVACVGSTINLAATSVGIGAGTATVGTGTSLTGDWDYVTAFNNRWPSYRMQMVFTAAELQAAGLSAGNITSMAFKIATLGSAATNPATVIKIGTSSVSALTTTFESTTGYTTVYPSQTYTHTASGIQTIPFSTPFVWNGTSNIIIDMLQNGADDLNNSQTYYSVTTANTVACTSVSSTATITAYNTRPNVVFGGQALANVTSSYNWSWNSTPAITTAAGTTVLPTGATTTYTVTATNPTTGCSATQDVTVSTAVSALALTGVTPASSNVCVGGSVTLTGAPTGGCIPYTYSWSDGTSEVGTSASLTISPTSTKTYTVTVVDNTGTATVNASSTITVNNPQPISVAGETKCATSATFVLGATVSNANNLLNWYAGPTGGSALASGATYTTPAISATTTYYVEENALGSASTGLGRISTTSVSNTTPSTYGLVFDLNVKSKLNSVDVYLAETTAGSLVMQLQNSTGTVINSKTIAVPAGDATTPVQYTVPLDFIIPAGTGYRLLAISSPGMVRESALGGFPYSLGAFGNITSGYISGTSTAYYFFYNWSLSDICTGVRVPVTATVTSPPTLTINSASSTVCAGSSTITPITVTSTLTNFDTYVWSSPATVTGDASGYTITPAAASGVTTYTLTATKNNTTPSLVCVNTATYNVTVSPVPSFTASASPATVCNGAISTLTAVLPARTADSYSFASTSSGVLDPMTSSTTLLASGIDNTASAVTTFPGSFVFNYEDVNYTNFSVSDNGVLRLGGVAVSTTQYGSVASATVLSALGQDMGTGSNGAVDYVMTGTAPNRILKVQWKTVHTWSTSNAINNTYQMWLYENGAIQYIYGALASSGTPAAGIGICGASTSNYKSVAVATSIVSSAAVTANSTLPVSGTIYTFTAPTTPVITWSPITGLYTDSGATTAYTLGTAATTVYAKPTTTGLNNYTATATNATTTCTAAIVIPVTVNANTTLALTSATATQTVCSGVAISDIVYTVTNGTGVTATLPTGLIGTYLGGTYTISGTPTASGTITVSGTGLCTASAALTGDITVSITAAPTGPATQSLSSLLTIGDIAVVGTNVVWYASSSDAASGTSPLSNSQLLANTTYYATQTVAGCTSTTSLEVTITTLANQDFDMTQFSYYPNPVIDLLNVSYSQDMTNVKVFNMIGQQLLNKDINATTTQIDMSGYANGAYFIQVSTENAMKTVRVIKK